MSEERTFTEQALRNEEADRRDRFARIRKDVARIRGNSWWGDYPVEDVEFLLGELERLVRLIQLGPAIPPERVRPRPEPGP